MISHIPVSILDVKTKKPTQPLQQAYKTGINSIPVGFGSNPQNFSHLTTMPRMVSRNEFSQKIFGR